MSKGSHHYKYSYSQGWLMPIAVVYPSSRPCLFNRALALPLLASLGLSEAEVSTCRARSSRDSKTIVEALRVRLGPGRRRSGILIVKVSGTERGN
jgi:hypothetical protein